MTQVSLPKEKQYSVVQTLTAKCKGIFNSLLLHWEIPLILFISAFLQLVNIDHAIFNDDEAGIFRLAHDAITSGWLPLTSSRASIGYLNPPLVVYFFMIPASFSANPLWGQVMVALFNTAAVLLTYFFVRRYYGRLAGAIAALLYATSVGAWTFSRNIWPQNFLPFFTILLIFILFRGVVEQRKGWFFWAILLMGVLYQFHGSMLYLFIPLGAAVLFAFKTIRLRDIGLGAIALLVLYAPYLIWEFHVHFIDVTMVFSTVQHSAQIDTEAIRFYLFFIRPILANPYLDLGAQYRDNHTIIPDGQSILTQSHLHLLLNGAYLLAIFLFLGGLFVAAMQILSLKSVTSSMEPKKNILLHWWSEFQAAPSKQGLAIILLWQVLPLLSLSRHTIVLFVHYFFFLLPGPFILIALCIVQIMTLTKQYRPSWEHFARYAAVISATIVILAQMIGIGSTIIDINSGNFNSPTFNDLHDEQKALQVADQVAQQRHINRIYITASPGYIEEHPMEYLAEQIKTPSEVFATDNCFFLPSLDAGPVVFLVNPQNSLADTLISQYTNATLVAEPPHLALSPYKVYVLTAKSEGAPAPHTFNQKQNLQLLSPAAQVLHDAKAEHQWLTTRWSISQAHSSAFRTTYGFNVQMQSITDASLNENVTCTTAANWEGDQLFVFRDIANGSPIPSQIAIQAATFISRPETLSLGPITGFVYYNASDSWQTLLTENQKQSITIPISDTNN